MANSTTKGFIRSALFLLNLAKKANDDGDYFPVWGTCMGFEFLLWAEGSGQEVRISCEANNQLDKLRFQKGFEQMLYLLLLYLNVRGINR